MYPFSVTPTLFLFRCKTTKQGEQIKRGCHDQGEEARQDRSNSTKQINENTKQQRYSSVGSLLTTTRIRITSSKLTDTLSLSLFPSTRRYPPDVDDSRRRVSNHIHTVNSSKSIEDEKRYGWARGHKHSTNTPRSRRGNTQKKKESRNKQTLEADRKTNK